MPKRKHPLQHLPKWVFGFVYKYFWGALRPSFIGAQVGLSAPSDEKSEPPLSLTQVVSAHGNSYYSTISLLMDELLPISTFIKYIPAFSLEREMF